VDPKIHQLGRALGAEVVGTVPEYSAGAFGVAKVEQAFRERRERRDAQHRVRELRREWDDRP
jgi:hypothetical protein